MAGSAAGLASFIAGHEIFRAVPPDILGLLAAEADVLTLADGEALIREGEAGDSMYLVVSGRLIATSRFPREETLELGAGQSVGELAFLTGARRSATVEARGDARVVRLPRSAFDKVAERHPEARAKMTQGLVRRLRQTQLSRAIRSSPILSGQDERVLSDLETELELMMLPAGGTLFRQGEPGDCLYVVISGMVRVLVRRHDEEVRLIAELGAGETVGEMAILADVPRSATVSAVRDTHLAKLTQAGYERLLTKHPASVARLVTASVVSRLAAEISGSVGVSRVPTTIAIVPGSPSVPLAEFGSSFRESLSAFGDTLLLDAARVDAALGRAGLAQTAPDEVNDLILVEWLGDQETDYRHVIYQADSTDSPWSQRCARQADRILIVGDPAANPAPGEFEASILRSAQARGGTPAELVLLYASPDKKPAGTRRWLAQRRVERHHHVTLGCRGDFDRVARFLTGNAIGLVLGGGFARGLAHAGVIRALEETGIPVDIIGGTSMGSIMAGGYAMGWSWEKLIRLVSAGGAAAFRDLTIPLLSLLTGRKLARGLDPHFQDLEIEDLRIPYFCISASLKHAVMNVHTRGSLLKAVLASSRAPGAFPPIYIENDLLVDGGLLNNVPVDVMKDLSNGGTVIAVDVSPTEEPLGVEDYGLALSGWRVLWQKISPFSVTKLPTVFNVLMRIIAFSGVAGRDSAEQLSDLYLHPPLEQFKINDFKRGNEMAEAAYAFSRKPLQEWWAALPNRPAAGN